MKYNTINTKISLHLRINTIPVKGPQDHKYRYVCKGVLYQIASGVTIRVILQLNRIIYYDRIDFYLHLKSVKNSKTFNNTKRKWLLIVCKQKRNI